MLDWSRIFKHFRLSSADLPGYLCSWLRLILGSFLADFHNKKLLNGLSKANVCGKMAASIAQLCLRQQQLCPCAGYNSQTALLWRESAQAKVAIER